MRSFFSKSRLILFFWIVGSHSAPATSLPRCEVVLNPLFNSFLDGLKRPRVVQISDKMQELETSGVTDALNPKGCAEFTNACALSAVMIGVEAIERQQGKTPASRQIITNEALILSRVIRAATNRQDASLTILETAGLLRFQLTQRNLLNSMTTKAERISETSDLALAQNEMLLLGADAPGYGKHIILMFHYSERDRMVHAFDPMTGKIEQYGIARTPEAKIRLVSLTNSVGPTAVLDLMASIRISPEPERVKPITSSSSGRAEALRLTENVRLLRRFVNDPYPLLPNLPKSRFPNIATARSFVAELLKDLASAEDVLSADLSQLDAENTALIFSLNLHTAELRMSAKENNFFGWLQHHGLATFTKEKKDDEQRALPQWTIPMLESRISSKFKARRELALQRVRTIATSSTLSVGDLNIGLGLITLDYIELFLSATTELQPTDAHKILTIYFNEVDQLFRSPRISALRIESNVFLNMHFDKWEEIRTLRKKYLEK